MNRISAIALFAAASFATLSSASAQNRLTETKVPFAFRVNGSTLPAGTYIVNYLSPKMVEIASADFKHPLTRTVMISADGNAATDGQTRLVFRNYGGQYFLHEIVSAVHSTDAVVAMSKEEMRIRMEWAAASGDQPVLVAVK